MKTVVIGAAGHMGYALEAKKTNPDIEFSGLAPGAPDEDVSGFYSASMKGFGTKLYDNYREMLTVENPETAVIATQFHLNGSIAAECMDRGIHVFVEKPIAFDMDQLERLRSLAETNNVKIISMLPYRYHPDFWAAYQAVKEGKIGEPLLINAQKSYKLGNRPGFYRHRETYGSTILWVGIHAIDWIYWFTEGQIETVTANHTVKGNRGHGELESSAHILYRLKNSGSAAANVDYFRPPGAPTHGDDRIRVAGEAGVVEVMREEARLLSGDNPESELEKTPPASLFGDFIGSIRGTAVPRYTMDDTFGIHELAIRTREAADTGKTIPFRQ
jgi:predicted dehydrogenase